MVFHKVFGLLSRFEHLCGLLLKGIQSRHDSTVSQFTQQLPVQWESRCASSQSARLYKMQLQQIKLNGELFRLLHSHRRCDCLPGLDLHPNVQDLRALEGLL